MESIVNLFQQGGVAMYPLTLCSVLSVAIILERAVVLRKSKLDADIFISHIRTLLNAKKIEEAIVLCEGINSPIARLVRAGLLKAGRGREVIEDALSTATVRESARLEQYLHILGTIGAVSPFIGLFGTVLGIMRAFRDIAIRGQAGTAVVAAGIAEALIATAAGLFVAIIAVIAYNYFLNWATLSPWICKLPLQNLFIFWWNRKKSKRQQGNEKLLAPVAYGADCPSRQAGLPTGLSAPGLSQDRQKSIREEDDNNDATDKKKENNERYKYYPFNRCLPGFAYHLYGHCLLFDHPGGLGCQTSTGGHGSSSAFA